MSSSYDLIADVYDADMGASMTLPDVAWYLRVARARGGPVLELGCGSGRILGALLEEGIDAVGVDLSAPMLRQARARCGARARLLRMDVRRLSLNADFALVLMPYSLATYLLDERDWGELAAGLAPALAPGATIVVDAFIPRPPPTGRSWMRDYARRLGGAWLVRHKRIRRCADGLHRIERRYRLRGAFGGRTLRTCEWIRPYSPTELVAYATRHLGEVGAIDYDYGTRLGPQGASFCTLTVNADARHVGRWQRSA